jgi:hypothetical protein
MAKSGFATAFVAVVLAGCTFGLDRSRESAEEKGAGQKEEEREESAADSRAVTEPPPRYNLQPTAPATEPEGALPAAEESAYSPDEPEEPESEPEDGGAESLAGYLVTMFGLRLPSSSAVGNLETVIGSSAETTVALRRGPGREVEEFAREILISVGRKEITVNGYRVANVQCELADGHPCSEDPDEEKGPRRYRIAADAGADCPVGPCVLDPLLKQLQYFQRVRAMLLSTVAERAASWLMDCDVYNIAADSDLPYSILAAVMHTAGYADLTRARLMVLDADGTLNYIPLLAPKADEQARTRLRLVGDDWWVLQSKEITESYAAAYLSFSSSLYPDTFAGLEMPTLPVCFPPAIAWDRLQDDSSYAASARTELLGHIAQLGDSHAVLLGLAPSPPPGRPSIRPALVVEGPGGAAAGEAGGAADGSTPLELHDFPRNRIVPAGGGDAPVEPAEHLGSRTERGGPGGGRSSAAAATCTQSRGVRPYVFMTADGNFALALKGSEGEVIEAVEIGPGNQVKMYDFLAAADVWLAHVGAAGSTTVQSFVEATDLLRHRCLVHTMSGKCKVWEPLFPYVVPFMAPQDSFGPVGPAGEAAPGGPKAQPLTAPVPARTGESHPGSEEKKSGSPSDDARTKDSGPTEGETVPPAVEKGAGEGMEAEAKPEGGAADEPAEPAGGPESGPASQPVPDRAPEKPGQERSPEPETAPEPEKKPETP